jgi:hypothetical protein
MKEAKRIPKISMVHDLGLHGSVVTDVFIDNDVNSKAIALLIFMQH